MWKGAIGCTLLEQLTFPKIKTRRYRFMRQTYNVIYGTKEVYIKALQKYGWAHFPMLEIDMGKSKLAHVYKFPISLNYHTSYSHILTSTYRFIYYFYLFSILQHKQ